MTLTTGNQLKAARALAGVDQQHVADSAKVNVNTIRNMEARGGKPITSSAVTIRRVQVALEALGIEFLNHTQPGVRLRIHRDHAPEWLVDQKPRRKKSPSKSTMLYAIVLARPRCRPAGQGKPLARRRLARSNRRGNRCARTYALGLLGERCARENRKRGLITSQRHGRENGGQRPAAISNPRLSDRCPSAEQAYLRISSL